MSACGLCARIGTNDLDGPREHSPDCQGEATRNPLTLAHYSVAAGRQVYRDGKPFISVGNEGDTRPTTADALTHALAVMLNEWAKRPPGVRLCPASDWHTQSLDCPVCGGRA